MKTWKRSCSAGAVLLSLGACASLAPMPGYSPTPYWTIHTPAFDNLKPGVTTKAEVRKQVGTPLTEMTFQRKNEDVWEYRYLDGTTMVMLAYVHFDTNGSFKYLEQRLDPAYHGGHDM
jgi:outer membrane protein assembly factor BamE (lipoprotein component of BamABCDE complex)